MMAVSMSLAKIDDRVSSPTLKTLSDASRASLSVGRVYIKTYGCQMNVYDSERMSEALAVGGFTSISNMDNADLIILNTCHIREKAAEKVYSELGRVRELKEVRAAAGLATVVVV